MKLATACSEFRSCFFSLLYLDLDSRFSVLGLETKVVVGDNDDVLMQNDCAEEV